MPYFMLVYLCHILCIDNILYYHHVIIILNLIHCHCSGVRPCVCACVLMQSSDIYTLLNLLSVQLGVSNVTDNGRRWNIIV